jgi:hypothetical protein
MVDLTLKDYAIDDDVLTVSSVDNAIEFQIILGADTNVPWIDLDVKATQRLHEYLGEWLAARQNTGLGGK